MEENKYISKEEKIQKMAKGLLIKFIVIMIVLTIISRIFNSIITPVVYVENIKGGTLTKKITANGYIKANDEINVNFKDQFLVDKIYYGIGEEVKLGNPLIKFDSQSVEDTLKKSESELKKLKLQLNKLELDTSINEKDNSLETAEKNLEILERDKNIILKKEEDKITNAKEDIIDAENNLKQKEQELFEAKEDYEKAKEDLLENNQKLKQDKIKEAEELLEKAKKNLDDKNYERDKALQKARQTLDEANNSLYDETTGAYIPQNYDSVKRAEMEYEFVKSDYERAIKEANEEIKKAEENLEEIKNSSDEEISKKELLTEEEKVKSAENNVKIAQDELKSKQKLLEDANYNKNIETENYNIKIEDAKNNIEDSKILEEENKIKANNEEKKQNIDKEILKLAIIEKEEYILKLKELIQNDYSIIASIDGIISSINAKEGEILQKENVVSLVPINTKYVFEVVLSEDEAKNIEKDDVAQIELNSEKEVLKDVPIYKILNYSDEDKTGKTISFLLEKGEPNIEGKMQIIKESKNYSNVISKDAIRMDSTNEYVFVVREKKTILGIENLATKVEIDKIEEGDRTVAIEGAFEPNDKIIIDSNKSINENDTVRIGEK